MRIEAAKAKASDSAKPPSVAPSVGQVFDISASRFSQPWMTMREGAGRMEGLIPERST